MTRVKQSIEKALADFRAGKMVIVVDDYDRENEGDLIIAAEYITPQAINFMVTHARGLVCLAMTDVDFNRLQIPMMVQDNRSPNKTAFGISIEAAQGISTGISVHDRAHTIKTAIDNNNGVHDIVMPGHIFPLQARSGGVLQRRGHTEAGVDLARLAGLKPAAVICEIMNADGTMARVDDLAEFAKQHNISMISIDELVRYRIATETIVREVAGAKLPIHDFGEFTIKTFHSEIDDSENLALVAPHFDPSQPCLVRMHSECLTGDVFGSLRCDCGQQLQAALAAIAEAGGVLLYLRQEGRGIGLVNKIKAYSLQEQGLDTVEANHRLGFAADERDYGLAAQMLKALAIDRVRLLTNNPRKVKALRQYGIDVVERLALQAKPTAENIDYLRTKQQKLGHWLTFDKEDEGYHVQ